MNKLKLLTVFALLLCCSGELDRDEFGSAFCTCPSECICTSEKIECSAKFLSVVPLQFKYCDWPGVTVLNITQNQITTLDASSFVGLLNLEKLYVNFNWITGIHKQSFIGLDSLLTLDLSSNRLINIHGSLFHPLVNLRNLYLHSNNISAVSNSDLFGLSSLKLIALDDNKITNLEADIFQSTKKLSSILLYSNQIRSLPDGIFNELDELLIIAIHNNKLQNISHGLFSSTTNLQRIYIQNNEISNISNGPFHSLDKLLLLYISGNHLQEITSNCLVGLSSLHTLILSNNQISVINDSAFSHMPVLQELYMDDNKVEGISRQMFASNWNLRILRLGKNNLHFIDDGAFRQQRNLYRLFLFENKLQNISGATFVGLYGMVELVINSNYISDLPANVFKDSIFLKNLWLRQNRIKCIDETAFQSQQRLELIDLAENEISYLPNDVFQYTPNVKYLLLSSNKLSKIVTRPFRNLPFLIQLVLFYNQITYIQEGSFEGTENILFLQWNRILDFDQDNALECGCEALWLQNYLFAYQPYYSSVYCGGPDYARGKNVLTVSEIQQNCTNNAFKVSIEPGTQTIHVAEGDCLRLKCKPSKTANLTWSLVGGKIRNFSHDECGLSVDQCGNQEDTTGYLSLAHFTKEDQGTYICTATGLYGLKRITAQSQIEIIIGEPPTVLKVPTNMVYRDPPSHVIFNFQASGSPEPFIEWYYNGAKIIFNHRFHMNQTGSLIILDTQQSDNGLYTAVANNGAGRVEVSATLSIYFPSPCYGVGCENGGSCIAYYQCVCPDGYGGNTCEQEYNTDTTYSGDYPYTQDNEDDYDQNYQQRKKRAGKEDDHEEIRSGSFNKKEYVQEQPVIDNNLETDSEHNDIKPINPEGLLSRVNQNSGIIDETELKKLFEEY